MDNIQEDGAGHVGLCDPLYAYPDTGVCDGALSCSCSVRIGLSDPLYVYGTDADEIRALTDSSPEMAERLHPQYAFTRGEVTWVVRNEMARTLEDVLARRLRILFMDARAAMQMAPAVAAILAEERGKDHTWRNAQLKDFNRVASHYILNE